jgi:hypothetical protein
MSGEPDPQHSALAPTTGAILATYAVAPIANDE